MAFLGCVLQGASEQPGFAPGYIENTQVWWVVCVLFGYSGTYTSTVEVPTMPVE